MDDFDPGALLEGLYNYVTKNQSKISAGKAREMLTQTSVQMPFGIANHSYSRGNDVSAFCSLAVVSVLVDQSYSVFETVPSHPHFVVLTLQ